MSRKDLGPMRPLLGDFPKRATRPRTGHGLECLTRQFPVNPRKHRECRNTFVPTSSFGKRRALA